MNAFISWSGIRELQIAKAIKRWLEAVVPEIKSFISPNLQKGKPWFDELAKELEGAEIGFLCLAPPRVASDWQLVEAGAIWKAAKSGGLFPLCFGVSEEHVPVPLRDFQLTQFDEEQFKQLAKDVAKLALPATDWTQERGQACEQAFEGSWRELKKSVEDALCKPDDGVHTTRGFIHEVAGGWWERPRGGNADTKLNWMLFAPSADWTSLTINGRGFGDKGSYRAKWETALVSINAREADPILEYYWEGREFRESNLLFGGKCKLKFTISANGNIDQGTGELKVVCMDEARPPTTMAVDLQRASKEEKEIMGGNDEVERLTLADRKLQAWP